MASNSPATDSAETLRDPVGEDPSATFEDDPTFVDSNTAGNGSSENLSAAADGDDEDDEVDEDDFEDDTEEDEEDEEDDLEDDADEADTPLRAASDTEADDDADDDGRENAVNEDDLNAEAEDDLDDSSLDPVEAETLRSRLVAVSIVPLAEVPSAP